MADVIKLRNASVAEQEAAVWIVRLDGGEPDEIDLDNFSAWLKENPLHRSEFVRLSSLWAKIDNLSMLAELIPLDEVGINLGKRDEESPRLHFMKKAVPFGGLAAVLLIGLAFYMVGSLVDRVAPVQVEAVYQTIVGLQDEVQLSDGSIIQLNTDTRLRVSYTGQSRNIELEKGEAHFKVVSNPGRPFAVFTGRGKVVAVGTAFNIRLHDDLVRVVVTHGEVEVFPSITEPFPEVTAEDRVSEEDFQDRIFLSEGNALEFGPEIKSLETLEPKELDRDLAWQRGMLIFEGESLEEAINEINRYTSTRIVIADPEIREIRVGGYFKAGETQAMLEAFESIFGLQVTRVSEDLIQISSKSVQQ